MKKCIIFLLCLPIICFAKITTLPTVAIGLSGGPEVGFVRVSSDSLFRTFYEFAFDIQKPLIQWNVCYPNTTCLPGEKMVYVQYLDTEKNILGTAQQVITYEKSKQGKKLELPKKSELPTPEIFEKKIPAPEIFEKKIPDSIEVPSLFPETKIVPGCVYQIAKNHNSNATIDDGSCIFPEKKLFGVPQKVIISSGVITGILQTLFLFFGYGIKITELPLLFTRMITQILVFIGARKRSTPWGTVIDAVSGQGLDPAIVTLYDTNNKIIQTTITDIEGRFGFLVPSGDYRISAQKTHYTFPSHYGYQGELFSITDQGVIAIDVPLQPVSIDWNEEEKRQTLSWWIIHRKKVHTLLSSFFFISLIISIVIIVIDTTWTNVIFLGLNILFLIIRLITKTKRLFGLVYDTTKKPLSGIIIESAFINNSDFILKKVITDQFGRYYFLTKKGNYSIKLVGKEKKIIYKDNMLLEEGFLNKDFIIR